MKEFETPSPVYSASYLPDKNIFVCGGEDFKMYKYEYSTGEELGTPTLLFLGLESPLLVILPFPVCNIRLVYPMY